MKKTTFLLTTLFLISACSSDNSGFGGGSFEQALITGDTDQAGVTYNDEITSIDFNQTSQVGDSTFYEATLDMDDNSSIDLSFTLVKWSDVQVLTLKGRNGVEIPFSDSEYEILEAQIVVPGINLVAAETLINSLIKNYAGVKDGFITYTRGNSVSVSANPSLWARTVYLPFSNPSSGKIGWIGLNIISNSGVQIDGIEIDVIAIK